MMTRIGARSRCIVSLLDLENAFPTDFDLDFGLEAVAADLVLSGRQLLLSASDAGPAELLALQIDIDAAFYRTVEQQPANHCGCIDDFPVTGLDDRFDVDAVRFDTVGSGSELAFAATGSYSADLPALPVIHIRAASGVIEAKPAN